jgi:predicted HNH restriction endonuclease
MSKLRQQAVEAGEENVESFGTTAQEVTSYNRSTAVREYAMARADGYCEACGNEAPFAGTDGKPYLQAHHINELGTGGEDTIENVIALCPNCHYRVHHGLNGEQFNQMLAEYLLNIE